VYWWTIITVLTEEENNIVTHQGVDKLIDGDERPNPKDVGFFQGY